jgi:hypothetical protein
MNQMAVFSAFSLSLAPCYLAGRYLEMCRALDACGGRPGSSQLRQWGWIFRRPRPS